MVCAKLEVPGAFCLGCAAGKAETPFGAPNPQLGPLPEEFRKRQSHAFLLRYTISITHLICWNSVVFPTLKVYFDSEVPAGLGMPHSVGSVELVSWFLVDFHQHLSLPGL